MPKVTDIVVKVELRKKDKVLSSASCIIPLTDEPIRAGKLLDACQRSVAHCIDELQKELDISR